MSIRVFEERDRERVGDIAVVCFEGVSIDQNMENMFGLLNGSDWKSRKRRDIDQDLNAGHGRAFVAEVDGGVMGFVTTLADPQTRVGRIPNLSVLSSARGMGLGKKLITAALDHLRSKGMVHVQIETLQQNAVAAELYPRLGFKEVARRIHFMMPLDEKTQS